MPRLLITDDSMFQRFLITKVVKEMGFETAEAKNGRECMERVRKGGVDALLIDLNMPDMKGIDVLAAIQQEKIGIPVLVITGDIQDSTRKRCLELGAADVMNKPVNDQVLKEKIAAIMGISAS